MVILPCTDKITSFFFNDTATTEIYPLSLHDALPIYWGTAYSIITRANLVLANGPGIDAPNAQMKAYNLAEAKLLRGYAYLWLVKVYDDVPLLLSPADQANPRPTRTPVEQVDQAIIKDLTEAEAALPTTWPSSDGYGNPTQGRVTKEIG